jgi:hypothetical protein
MMATANKHGGLLRHLRFYTCPNKADIAMGHLTDERFGPQHLKRRRCFGMAAALYR